MREGIKIFLNQRQTIVLMVNYIYSAHPRWGALEKI